MATPLDELPFAKRLAVLLSRALNSLNPNEVLAKTVFQLSKNHNLTSFTKAISAFGKFSQDQAQEIFELCQQQDTIEEAFSTPGAGLTITDSDVLEPEQAGGRPGLTLGAGLDDKHVFKAPALPQRSALGLDRLAAEKRKERGETSSASASVKRIKYDEEDEVQPEEFKSASSLASLASSLQLTACALSQYPRAPSLARATCALGPRIPRRTQEDFRTSLGRSWRSTALARPSLGPRGWWTVGTSGRRTNQASAQWRASESD